MVASHLEIGRAGEEAGIAYLKKSGYRILKTNFKTPFGELDCIAKDKKTLVFIEIKTRQSSEFGLPEESVHRRKQKKIIQSAQYYLKSIGGADRFATRFDVLSVFSRAADGFDMRLIQDAFELPSTD